MVIGPSDSPVVGPYHWSMQELTRFWGVAENGEVMELAVRPHLVDRLLERWPPVGLARHDEPVEPVVVQRGLSDEWIIIPDRDRSGDNPPLLAWDQLEQSMTLFAVQRMTRLVAVHSAVFVHDGRAIIVAAESGGGKSTLTVAAAEAGVSVLTDEYALLDPATGLVSGWRRPVRILCDDGTADRRDVAVDSDPVPVGLVAFVSYRSDVEPGWSELSPAEIAGELLGHTISARDRPHESFDAALAVARTARGVKGTRGDAVDTIGQLLALLD